MIEELSCSINTQNQKKYHFRGGRDMIPFPNKKYQIILADPAWSYNDKLGDFSKFANKNKSPKMGACEYYYNTLSIDDICNLPIKEISHKDCILFLWVTMPKLNECFKVISEWGFKYKTCAFTWIKLNPKSGTIFKGIGRWVQGNAELCLLATKGHPKRISKSISQIIMAKRGRHSQKPDTVRKRIVELMGNLPRIELFARGNKEKDMLGYNKFEGWDVWGNEV